MRAHLIKRCFDVSIVSFLLILCAPLFLVIALLIYFNDGLPIIFCQKRPGLNCKIFTIYKFRTMSNAIDKNGNLLSDEQRLTRMGRFLRSTSLDELPELFNVLTGTMSLVGPRPLLVESLPYYSAEQNRRHEVLPGITGLAQVSGRNSLPWEERFKLDVWYVDHGNFWLDIKIMLKTIIKVITREGINEEGFATASDFGLEHKLSPNKTEDDNTKHS